MHRATFHTETGGVLFLPSWVLHGKKEIYLSCLFIVALGIGYQGIKFVRQQYGRKCRNLNCRSYMLTQGHLVQTLLYLMQFVGGYLLMLAAMTYNLWLLVAVLAGFGLGYFLFGWGEYEESAGRIPIPARLSDGSGRPALHICGTGKNEMHVLTTSSSQASATQELLPRGKWQDEDIVVGRHSRSCGACNCGSSKV